ncbi:hypothetical protein GA0070609_6021 [Micromonospora echinaurantiaca]|uniref:Uncharacterized protein n=1 Tax=Micromonospora echinaurantiaca TaxID=47857 RepID=A0A1C5KA70_9ACTN|nr:hypothetical protein [Micromonospora echinaurantiaca]SCG79725.1 hypothetical protein GA0070609_6021 [Micromonospora echinaurantiaca]
MSYPDQAPTRRPAVVVLAAAVLAVMAVAAVGYAVAGLLALGGAVAEFRSAAAGTSARPDEIDGMVTLLRVSTVLTAVVSLLGGLLLAGLALGLLAGRSGARVGTWVVSGLGLLFGCCGLAVLVGQRAAPLRLGADERTTAELLALLGDAQPGWWLPVNAGLSVGQVLGYLVVAALLALPAANAWFRRRPPVGPTDRHQPPAAPLAPPYPPR